MANQVILSKSTAADGDYNPSNKTWPEKVIGDYEVTTISTSPLKVKVTGNYDTSKAPLGGGGDALHSFQSRKKDKFGGKMHEIVNAALRDVYKQKINPFIESITITMGSKGTGPVVNWEVMITSSTDGKAYVGLNSRGGAGGKSDASARALKQANQKKKDLPGELNEPKLEYKDVLDYENPNVYIRQIFWQYTMPNQYPPLSGSQSETGLSASTTPPQDPPVVEPVIEKPALSGKVIIKKKSGPGEITGVTEKELELYGGFEAASATFTDIQFTEPGDYVVTISSDNPQVDFKEYKIKILPADEIVPQEESKGTDPKKQEPVSGTRPIISQIDQPSIKIKKIEMQQDPTGPKGQAQYTDGLGYTPFVWYQKFQIREEDIRSLQIYHVGIIPKITLTFADPNGSFKDDGTPMNDTTMDLFLNSTSKNLKSIHFVFKIEEFIANKAQPGQTFTIRGTINVPDLYVIANKSFNDTSFGALRTMCKELGLGFNSNIDNTNDKMSWRNTNKKPYEFIEEIIAHSYINDDSYMAGYIDWYFCFNYVDLEKEYNRNISGDVGLDTSGLSQQTVKEETERIMPLILTNDKSNSSSSNYIESYKTRNNSMKKSLVEGYSTVTKSYDRVNKQFLVFSVDSTQSDPSKNKLLRGAQEDSKFFDENIKTIFTGKLDTDNTHFNYNYAMTQNRINLNVLSNISLDVTLPNANYNLYKYLKVKVNIFNETTTPQEPSILNNRYSGEYIIADIEWHWSKGKMSQKLKLIRKELSKDVNEVKEDPPMQKAPEQKQINDNPLPPGTTFSSAVSAPNSIYVVGQKYLVQDKNNKLYELTVKQLSNNGVEVVGTIKETQRKNT